jgi:hypothetical protein
MFYIKIFGTPIMLQSVAEPHYFDAAPAPARKIIQLLAAPQQWYFLYRLLVPVIFKAKFFRTPLMCTFLHSATVKILGLAEGEAYSCVVTKKSQSEKCQYSRNFTGLFWGKKHTAA